MPELAEVEYHRRKWEVALGTKITGVDLSPGKRVFRGTETRLLLQALPGAILTESLQRGKQMAFRFADRGWLGLHLGMTGELRVETPGISPERHDHFLLRTQSHALVFRDPRLFGRVQWWTESDGREWWDSLPMDILDKAFTRGRFDEILQRRRACPLKALLLMQEFFPGVGNWMADEILWRARILPQRQAASLNSTEIAALYRSLRWVCREARRIVAPAHDDPPPHWLFRHRWEDGGTCPKTGSLLLRETVGGRTTCWSPAWQK